MVGLQNGGIKAQVLPPAEPVGVEKGDPQEPQPLRMSQRGGIADQFFLRIVLVQPVQCACLLYTSDAADEL